VVSVHFLKTAFAKTAEAFTIAGGSLFKSFRMVHGAVLVQHGKDTFLFDTGLGQQIDAQFAKDMPFWLKPMMAYQKQASVLELLKKNPALPRPKRIFLSHTHWDHASGVVDFPKLEIWVTKEELHYTKTAKESGLFPSQVGPKSIRWRPYQLQAKPYAGFPESYDLYGDGTVVFVRLFGHTPGSVGLFVNAKDGIRRFFVGDAVWNVDSIKKRRGNFWISSRIADHNTKKARRVIAQLHALHKANPTLQIIPAHDLRTWK
jgi:glyoxylase-like metal-dependent hydrolase (beta-lactamase superfamily II)